MIKRPKGARAARAFGVLMVKMLNKCILNILVYNQFLDRQRNLSIHQYTGCLHEIDIPFFKI